MCCIEFIAKYVLFLANLVFSLTGITIIVLGSVLMIQLRDIREILPLDLVLIGLIVLGCVVFVIAFLACCGAVRESRCMLNSYAVCMLVLAGLKIYLSVVVFDSLSTLQTSVASWLNTAFNNTNLRPAFHALEALFQCCGTVGSSSYGGQALPPTCCANPINNTCEVTTAFGGCNPMMSDYLGTFGEAIGAVLIVIIIIEVALIAMACFFQCRISGKSGKVMA